MERKVVLGGGKDANPGGLFLSPEKFLNECFAFGRRWMEQRADIFAHILRAGRARPYIGLLSEYAICVGQLISYTATN